MKQFNCIVHGSFVTNIVSELCPRCLDMEHNSVRDLISSSTAYQAEIGKTYSLVSDKEMLFKEGHKDDAEKPDLSLLPREFLEEVAKAFMHGEKKYGRYNYRNGMDWHRIIAASIRHISAFNEGENTDSESGLNHLGHAGACIAMLVVYFNNKLGTDTRYKP